MERISQSGFLSVYIIGDRKDNQKCAAGFAGLKLATSPFTAPGSLRQAFFGDIHSYGGPDVWLSLIRDAEYVITDSFHAVVFSIVYRKQFVVLRRSEDGVASALEKEKGRCLSWLWGACSLEQEDK